MKNTTAYNFFFVTMMVLSCYSLMAQNSESASANSSEFSEVSKRQENFNVLKNLGYKEREIYEDLGNANFLNKNYDTAIYWYTKLFEFTDGKNVSTSYYERYHYALQVTNKAAVKNMSNAKDWVSQVKSDYRDQKNDIPSKDGDLYFTSNAEAKRIKELVRQEIKADEEKPKETDSQSEKNTTISNTGEGKTGYFTKPVDVKPLYGVFSKKELLHKIYKAEKVKGQWKNAEELALCPSNYSSRYPTVSEDGKRLFFASNMPGSFGMFDLYVAAIDKNVKFGIT